MKWSTRIWILLAGAALLLLALFLLNGLVLAPRNRVVTGQVLFPAEEAAGEQARVTIMAWNVAKGFAYKGGFRFESTAATRQRLDEMAAFIKAQQPDLVFLSEVMATAGTCRVNQVEYLAEHSGLPYYAYGENFNLGIPGMRASSGNAVLSRFPLEGDTNMDLAGRKSFLVSYNNRRALFAHTRIGGESVLLVSVHNDSFDLDNNLEQIREIIVKINDRPAILAGDFNARPENPPIQTVLNSQQFSGSFKGPGTVPAEVPKHRIDYVFAPKSWSVVDTQVHANTLSDHRPVVSIFEVSP